MSLDPQNSFLQSHPNIEQTANKYILCSWQISQNLTSNLQSSHKMTKHFGPILNSKFIKFLKKSLLLFNWNLLGAKLLTVRSRLELSLPYFRDQNFLAKVMCCDLPSLRSFDPDPIGLLTTPRCTRSIEHFVDKSVTHSERSCCERIGNCCIIRRIITIVIALKCGKVKVRKLIGGGKPKNCSIKMFISSKQLFV